MAFDYRLPIYNWFYPLAYDEITSETRAKLNSNSINILNYAGANSRFRALYFHIPFCEDICTFCPFYRVVNTDELIFEYYTQALVKEIEIKSKYVNISHYPVDAIFFGGGTPSILTPTQIRKIGKALHEHFDLSRLKEFSYECHLTTVSEDRIAAMKDIGVTHARMGVQTFNPKYRKFFNLVESTDLIYRSVGLLTANFPFTSVDLLYGMHGQTFTEFVQDLNHVVQLNTPTIDVYPINNVVTQTKLHKELHENNMEATSGFSKTLMAVILREYMWKSGYLPHNGHGFVKVDSKDLAVRPVVTDQYRFQYHEAHFGYKNHDIIGFGSGAWSITDGFIIENPKPWKSYMDDLHKNANLNMKLYEFDPLVCESKGVAFHLPYHGEADKEKINWQLVRPEVIERLQAAIARGLVVETPTHYRLTDLGWLWYGNLLYYLSPNSEQEKINAFIAETNAVGNRFVENSSIDLNFPDCAIKTLL